MKEQIAWRLSAGLLLALLLGSLARSDETAIRSTAGSAGPMSAAGAKLYSQHGAACHGATGDGNGPAAAFLFPKPRNFQFGKYRLVSTENQVPSQADLEALLVRGMPGSSMPSWAHLKLEVRVLLAQEVYRLAGEGARLRYIENLKKEQGLTDEDIKTKVQEIFNDTVLGFNKFNEEVVRVTIEEPTFERPAEQHVNSI